MPLSDALSKKLIAHPLWVTLTVKQQSFVRIFLETGDARAAVRQSYNCRTENSVITLCGIVTRGWRVRHIVKAMGGHDLGGSLVSKEEAMQLVSDRLRDPRTEPSTFRFLFKVYADFRKWDLTRKHKPVDEAESVDTIVQQIEQRKKQNGEKDEG